MAGSVINMTLSDFLRDLDDLKYYQQSSTIRQKQKNKQKDDYLAKELTIYTKNDIFLTR